MLGAVGAIQTLITNMTAETEVDDFYFHFLALQKLSCQLRSRACTCGLLGHYFLLGPRDPLLGALGINITKIPLLGALGILVIFI